MIKVLASVLAADVLAMREDVQRILDAGADILHLDIMDAHFVPNLSYGPDLVRRLHEAFPDVYLDVHLMMTDPEDYVDAFAQAGASAITVHAEIGDKALGTLERIRALGLEAGISFKPHTPLTAYHNLLRLSDQVLLMTVEPGFGGQKMMPEALHKARDLREQGFAGHISVDGGVNEHNAYLAVEKGADWLVLGTALFGAPDPRQVVHKLHALGGSRP